MLLVQDQIQVHVNHVFKKDILKIQLVFHNVQKDYGKMQIFGDVILVMLHAKLVKDLVQTNVLHAQPEVIYSKLNA